MIKSELVQKIADHYPELYQRDAENVVNAILEEITNALARGDRVELRAPAKTEHLEIIDVKYAPIPMDPFREPLGAQSTPKVERS